MIYVLVLITNIHIMNAAGGGWATHMDVVPIATFDNRPECEMAQSDVIKAYRFIDMNAPGGDTMATAANCQVFRLNDWPKGK